MLIVGPTWTTNLGVRGADEAASGHGAAERLLAWNG